MLYRACGVQQTAASLSAEVCAVSSAEIGYNMYQRSLNVTDSTIPWRMLLLSLQSLLFLLNPQQLILQH